jgi:hypothetical protein
MSQYRVKTSEYKGHPILEIWEGDQLLVRFGKRKALAVVAVSERIQSWVEAQPIRGERGDVGTSLNAANVMGGAD